MSQNYKFQFADGETVEVPMWLRSRAEDGTRTPIVLTGKRLVLVFRRRGGSVILTLDTETGATSAGSLCEIVDEDEGSFRVLVTEDEIAAMPVCYGDWEFWVYEPSGTGRRYWTGPFARE